MTGKQDKLRATMRAVFDLTSSKPTVYDVLLVNATVRGTVVATPEEMGGVEEVEAP